MKKLLLALSAIVAISTMESCAGFKKLSQDIWSHCPTHEIKPKQNGGFIVYVECDSTAYIAKEALINSFHKLDSIKRLPAVN